MFRGKKGNLNVEISMKNIDLFIEYILCAPIVQVKIKFSVAYTRKKIFLLGIKL